MLIYAIDAKRRADSQTRTSWDVDTLGHVKMQHYCIVCTIIVCSIIALFAFAFVRIVKSSKLTQNSLLR